MAEVLIPQRCSLVCMISVGILRPSSSLMWGMNGRRHTPSWRKPWPHGSRRSDSLRLQSSDTNQKSSSMAPTPTCTGIASKTPHSHLSHSDGSPARSNGKWLQWISGLRITPISVNTWPREGSSNDSSDTMRVQRILAAAVVSLKAIPDTPTGIHYENGDGIESSARKRSSKQAYRYQSNPHVSFAHRCKRAKFGFWQKSIRIFSEKLSRWKTKLNRTSQPSRDFGEMASRARVIHRANDLAVGGSLSKRKDSCPPKAANSRSRIIWIGQFVNCENSGGQRSE